MNILALLLLLLPRGVTLHTLHDDTFNKTRRVWVYTPPGYDAQRAQPYELIVGFDGEQFLDTIPLPAMLDSLTAARKTPPFVAVMIEDYDGAERIGELGNVARFGDFMSKQLMPWVRAHYNVTRDPHRTIITGSSAGGLASLDLALSHPELFGVVLSQSAALWRGAEASNSAPYEWLTQQYASAPKRDVRMFVDVGALETRAALGGAAPSILEAHRHLLAVLRKKNYDVVYTEVPGGVHAPFSWRARLPTGLVVLSKDWLSSSAR